MTPDIDIHKDCHVLIAGPTASGKSALALSIAQDQGGIIVNADAIQVYAEWRLLTARPSREEEARAPHHLFGHIRHDQDYSVGHWLREVEALLSLGERLIIVGGTGLYFSALTEGLARIPPTPQDIRTKADKIRLARGVEGMLPELDAETCARIDQNNPMRVQRAWEVLKSTGRSLADWQDDTPPPLLPLTQCYPIVLQAEKDWLSPRIEMRFDQMIEGGAIEEVQRNLDWWDPALPAAKAIGAPEIVAHLDGHLTLPEAREAAIIATRQYAKRQRTWFRSRMKGWHELRAKEL